MRSFKSANLECMSDQAIDMELWEEGYMLCNAYLRNWALELREGPRAHDKVRKSREQCEVALLQQSRITAEANFDFETCLQLLDDWETLWEFHNRTRERQRRSFIILGRKLLEFLNGCYRDRCVPCARWARLRKQTVCTFDNQSRNQRNRGRLTIAGPTTRHHDRNKLRVPFGCSHHCEGGYVEIFRSHACLISCTER